MAKSLLYLSAGAAISLLTAFPATAQMNNSMGAHSMSSSMRNGSAAGKSMRDDQRSMSSHKASGEKGESRATELRERKAWAKRHHTRHHARKHHAPTHAKAMSNTTPPKK